MQTYRGKKLVEHLVEGKGCGRTRDIVGDAQGRIEECGELGVDLVMEGPEALEDAGEEEDDDQLDLHFDNRCGGGGEGGG